MTASLLATVQQSIATKPEASELWVAYSGGRDSHVLLHLLATLSKRQTLPPLNAVHVNHNLNADAQKWVTHTQQICRQLDVPLTVVDVHIHSNKNLEARARHARYQAFEQYLPKSGLLLLAHHQQDQAETFLLHAIRGSGVAGLAGMPQSRICGQGTLLRPLLNVPSKAIQTYARQQQLDWIEDPSNQSLHHDRNYLRKIVLPLIKTRWPMAVAACERAAQHCREFDAVLDELIEEPYQHLLRCNNSLCIDQLKRVSLSQQKILVRRWLEACGGLNLTTTQLNKVFNNVIDARADATPILHCQTIEIRRFQQRLYLHHPLKLNPTWEASWDGSEPLSLPAGLGWLTVSAKDEIDWPLQVRFRQGGERMHPKGRCGSHPLKKLMQEWQIPPWLRNQVPLLFKDERLIAVVGYATDASLSHTSFTSEKQQA